MTSSAPRFALDPAAREAAKRIILLTAFLDILGFGIVIPQLGIYAAQFGAKAWQVGLLASTYSAMGFLFTPFWGRLSDRIGRRPVLLYSIFGTGVGYVIFAFANAMPLLFLSRFVDGVTGGNISVAQAYLSDITPPEERARNFGIFGAIFGIGFAIGPLIGWGLSLLPTVAGVNLGGNLGIGGVTALLGFTNWYLAVRRLPETLPPAVREANAARDAQDNGASRWMPSATQGFGRAFSLPGFNLLVGVTFLLVVAFATLQGTFTLFLIKEFVRPEVQTEMRRDPQSALKQAQKHLSNPHGAPLAGADESSVAPAAATGEAPYSRAMGGDFDARGLPAAPRDFSWRRVEQALVQPRAAFSAGLIFFAIGATALVIQGKLIGPIKKRIGEMTMVCAGTLVMALGLALVPLPHVFWGEFPVMMLLAAGNSIATPVLTAMASQLAPENERGELLGVYQSVQSLARIVGPIAGSFAFEWVSAGAPYFLGAFVMLGAFAATLRLRTVHLSAVPAA